MKISPSVFMEILSLLIAIIFYKRLKLKSPFLWFIPFLFITVIVELIGGYYRYVLQERNIIFYNFYNFIVISFFVYFYYQSLQTQKFKKLILIYYPFIFIFWLVNMLFFQGLHFSNTYTNIFRNIFHVVFALLFFYESLQSSNLKVRIEREPLFWVSTGVLFYYASSIVVFSIYQYISNNNLQIAGIRLYDVIISILNLILYSCYIVAFTLCPKPR